MRKSSAQAISIGVFVMGLAALALVGLLGFRQWTGGGQTVQEQARSAAPVENPSGGQGFFDRFSGLKPEGMWESGPSGEDGAGKTTFIAYEQNGMPAYDLYFVPRDSSMPVYFVRGIYEYDKERDEMLLTPRRDMGEPANHTEREMHHLGLRPYTVKIRKGKGDSMIWVPQEPRGHINRMHPIFAYMHVAQDGQLVWRRSER